MSRIVKKPRSEYPNEYGLACPKCGHSETLSIEITCTATLTIDGTDAGCDHYWDETSSCICDACDHHGVVSEFRSQSKKAVRS